MSNQERLTSKVTVVPADLEAFLSKRGCSPNFKQGLEITPAPKGSGHMDISTNHDRILGEQPLESQA